MELKQNPIRILFFAAIALLIILPFWGGMASADNHGEGAAVFAQYKCGMCHTIEGVRGAMGMMGPNLTTYGTQDQILGTAEMTQENLIQFIGNPGSIKPGSMMPGFKMSDEDAAALADYLMSLE